MKSETVLLRTSNGTLESGTRLRTSFHAVHLRVRPVRSLANSEQEHRLEQRGLVAAPA